MTYYDLRKDVFTAADIFHHDADILAKLAPLDTSLQHVHMPLYSGRLMAHEVQPGLVMSAHDITYLSHKEFAVQMNAALMCCIKLRGSYENMTIDTHGKVEKVLEQAVLIGFGERVCCRQAPCPNATSCGVGFCISPEFFNRFGESINDSGLTELQDFIKSDFRHAILPKSICLIDLAQKILDNPYNGHLGQLFLESNSLGFVTEVACLLRNERRLIASIGKNQFERVIEARHILDKNIVSPPKTLDLARQVGVNITTLQANFKKLTGTTIFNYVKNQRLQVARILLQDHKLSVNVTAHKVGFTNPAAFSAAYRRQFGHPPIVDSRQDKLQ